MPTALDLITTGLRKARVLGVQRTPSAAEANDGLDTLNSMLDAWAIERLMVYQIVQGSYSWGASVTSRTIGSGGNFNATRPTRVDSAYWRDSSSHDSPVRVLQDRTEYDGIGEKSTSSSVPGWLYYDPAYPLGTLYLYPVPSAAGTLLLNTWQTLQSFASLTTDLALPPAYRRLIEHSLAVELAPMFGMSAPQEVKNIADATKKALKGLNQPSMAASLDDAVAFAHRGHGRRDIHDGP